MAKEVLHEKGADGAYLRLRIILFLDLTGIIEATGYTNYFVYGIYGAIISFYFGLRTVEKKKIESLIKKRRCHRDFEDKICPWRAVRNRIREYKKAIVKNKI
ncbi:MAG: hypothetical protein OCU17_06245 [Methanophagales archaeon]|nr:hypothetical protein [Methanophagales archaeon]